LTSFFTKSNTLLYIKLLYLNIHARYSIKIIYFYFALLKEMVHKID